MGLDIKDNGINVDQPMNACVGEKDSSEDLDVRLQKLAEQCPSFYKNGNLLRLYLLMIPGCLVPAITLGFDATMINGLQAVTLWDTCELTTTGLTKAKKLMTITNHMCFRF